MTDKVFKKTVFYETDPIPERTLLELIYNLREFSRNELLEKYGKIKQITLKEIALVDDYLSQLMQIDLLLRIGEVYVLESHYRKVRNTKPD
jgi:hypothetical protein